MSKYNRSVIGDVNARDMPRKSYKNKADDFESDGFKAVWGIATLGVMYFGFVYYTDKTQFWYEITHYLLPVITLIALIAGLYLVYLSRDNKRQAERESDLLLEVRESGFETAVNNFIDRFGKEGKKEAWKYRSYAFDWNRMKDFREAVVQQGIEVITSDYHDIVFILKHYIDLKEKDFLHNGILSQTEHKFSELNKEGSDLEHLIVRLYNAMGYVSKRNGGSGDQGADVIASKDGDNVLIQAKCYTNQVSNEAVQQAFAALSYHGCNKAVVITTASFTPGAMALAQANHVELIDGERLKRMLLEHLGEIWL